MTTRAVHWHEGMFIRPQHFQAAQRHWNHLVDRGARFDLHYNWGLRSVELDLDALGNFRAVIRSLRARFRDGTLVSIPDDGLLPTLDLKEAFQDRSNLTLYVGVPVLHLGRANASTNGAAEGSRYVVDTQELE